MAGNKKLKLAAPPPNNSGIDLSNPTLTKIHATINTLPKLNFEAVEENNFLSELLAPIPLDVFHKYILHEKCVAILGNGPKRVEKLIARFFENGETLPLLQNTASESISIWLPSNNANNASVDSFKTEDAALAQRLFETNQASLYFRASEDTCDQLTKLVLQGLDWPLGVDSDGQSRGEVEVFLGNKRNATPTHTDFQHNFTIQLVGSKLWRFKRGDLANPLAAKSTHFANTPDNAKEHQLLLSSVCMGTSNLQPPSNSEETGWEEVELQAGDVMYHPPGMWHNVATTSLHSLSCNISLVSPSWADLVSQAVRQVMWKHALYRQPVCMRDFAKVKLALQNNGDLDLANIANGLQVLNHLPSSSNNQQDSEEEEEDVGIAWNGETRTLPGNKYTATTRFKTNPLAVVLFDTDAAFSSSNEEEEEEDSFNYVVSVNIGASTTTAVECMARFQVQDIPRSAHALLTLLRPNNNNSQNIEWTSKDLEACIKRSNAQPARWDCVADMLVQSGWWLIC